MTIQACIAICTCDRHEMLRDLLAALAKPRYRDVPIIIVDNGAAPAQEVVDAFRPALDIRYERLIERGLSPVRNRALALAKETGAEFVACIDDDEYPVEGWLDALLAQSGQADIVYGPVLPDYLAQPPKWVEDAGIFVRKGAFRGTGNMLLRLSLLSKDKEQWFRQEFSATGGEDNELLRRLETNGARVAVADDAIAYEQIPPSRMTLHFVLKRGLRIGAAGFALIRLNNDTAFGRTKAYLAFVGSKLAYALNHAFWGVLGQRWHLYMMAGDLAAIGGLVTTFAGGQLRFYGIRPNVEG